MQVFTPGEVTGKSEETGKKRATNKYLAVLAAAKYARLLNEFPRDRSSSREKKLTTRSLEELTKGGIEFRVVPRRRASVTE
jgi:DNA-directed RNA polymerase subunit K/omega